MAEDKKPPLVRKSFAQEWQEFRRAVLPFHIGANQLIETRRAYYAGAAAMFNLMSNLDEDAEATEEDVAYMESLFAELEQFTRMLAAGLA